jgi:hypothetical protein
MSGHADTIRVAEGVLAGEPGARYMGVDRDLAERALALVAENQQLRDALERFYAEVDKAQRLDNTGGDSAVSVTLNSWDEYLHDDRPALAGTPSEDT